MGQCQIDHSQEDTLKKLESQQAFLPDDLFEELQRFLKTGKTQEELNELFHLFKKYDLVSKEKQEARNEQLREIIKNNK